jgi:hypothetical protein
MADGHGWSGTTASFLSTPSERVLDELAEHHLELWGMPPSGSQLAAWRDELAAMVDALRRCCEAMPEEAPR